MLNSKIKFELNSKTFFLTYPRCPLEPAWVLERLKTRFLLESVVLSKWIVAQEKHKDGEFHIHAYVQYSRQMHLRKANCFDLFHESSGETYHGNYQSTRSNKNVIKYCVKGGFYLTNMEDELNTKIEKEEKKMDMKDLIEGKIEVKDLVQRYPNVSMIQNYSRLKANLTALRLDLRPLPKRAQVCGKWLIGPPDTGKSHFARTVVKGDLFVKLQTKWWCGYSGQKYVLLEDLSKPGPHSALDIRDLGYFLKLWTDKWGDVVGETKGGANVPLVYSSFWVSSNYTIDEIFESLNDASLLAAIKRRFVIISIPEMGVIGDIEKPDRYEDSNTQMMIEEMKNPKTPKPQNPKTPEPEEDPYSVSQWFKDL